MNLPVRTNADLTVNGSGDGWVVNQGGPLAWTADIADGGTPPAWWVGIAPEDGRSPIGPHGPGIGGVGRSVVTRATSLLADPLVSEPFVVELDRLDPARPKQRIAPPRWITDPQLLRPDDRFPWTMPAPARRARSVFWRQWIVSALYWGHGFLYFLEDATGGPLAGTLRVLDPALVHVDDAGLWRLGEVQFNMEGRLPDLGPNGARLVRLDNPVHPKGVFAEHPDVFTLTAKLARYTAGTFNSGVPAGYLKVTQQGLTKDKADELKEKWMAAHGGDRRSIAVLNATTDFHALSLSPIDSNLVEVKRTTIADAAYAFGMAPEALGVTMGNSSTYANIKDWWRAHRDFALSPWADTIGGTLTALTPAAQSVAVDLDGHSRPDENERIATYAAAIAAGFMTVDEARAREGLPPLGQEA